MLHSQKSQRSNLDELAALHRVCFPGSLSKQLGMAYSKKTLLWFLSDANRFLLHIEKEGEIVGYVGGFVSQFPGDGSTSGMLRYAMQEAVWGVCKKPWLIFHPQVRPMYPLIFKNIQRKITFNKTLKNNGEHYADKARRVGLVVIGVLPAFRGHGVFELLMSEFENESRLRQINHMALSVKKNNPHAIHAYQKCGWLIEKEHEDSFEMSKEVLQN